MTQEVVLLGGVAFLEEVCHYGCGLSDLLPNWLRMLSLLAAFGLRCRTLLLLRHRVCLDATMLPAMIIMDRTSESVKPALVKCACVEISLVIT